MPASGDAGRPVPRGAGNVALAQEAAPSEGLARYASFAQVLDLIAANRDLELKIAVESGLRLARYSPGRIEFTPTDRAPRDLASRLAQRLQGWTGVRWGVSVVTGCEAPTIAELRDAEQHEAEARARDNPLVQAVLAAFPGAKVTLAPRAAETAAEAALPIVEEEWDPFEEG